MSASPKSIVHLRPDTIGDLVIFSAALDELIAAWPEAMHTIVVRPAYASLAPLFSPKLRWVVARLNPFQQKPREVRAELGELLAELAALEPDLIVASTLNRTWLEAAVAARFPSARRVVLGSPEVDPLFATALRLDLDIDSAEAFSEILPADATLRDVENNRRLVAHLVGRDVPQRTPSVIVSPEAQERAHQFLAANKLAPQSWVAVFPAGVANVPIKAWAPERFAELVVWLQRERKLPVVLLAHTNESAIVERVSAEVHKRGGTAPIAWLGRDGEVPVLAALLAQAKLYIGNDTGAMHVAAAVGRPTLGIFGGGHWPRFRPFGQQVVSVVHPLPCFGCNWDCYFGDSPCVREIGVSDVQHGVERLLGAGAAPVDEVVEAANLPATALQVIAAATPRFRSLQRDRIERQHKIEELKRETDHKDTEIADLKSAAEDRKNEMESIKAELEAECADKDKEIAELKAETDVKDTEIADLKSAAEDRKNEMESIKAELEAECADKDKEIAELKTETDGKDGEIASLKDIANERERLVFTLDGHVKEFQRMVGELQGALADKDRSIADLQRMLTQAQADDAQQAATARAEGDQRLAQKDSEFEPTLKRLAELEHWVRHLPADADRFVPEFEAKNTHIRNIEAMLAHRAAEIAQLQTVIAEKDISLAHFQAGLHALEGAKHYSKQLAEKEAVIQMLHKACVEREKVIQRLAVEATGFGPRVAKLLHAAREHWRLKVATPFDDWLFKKVVEQYWMQIGVLRHYEPRPLVWDRFPKPKLAPELLPQIGIVTPSYNQATFIESTMLSVLNQNYPKLLYVVQDGGSKDGSADIIRKYGPRLKHFESARDAGQADAVRKGFLHLERDLGPDDLMAWLNSDDFIAPRALRFVAEYFAKHPEVDCVYGHRIIIDPHDGDVGRWVMPRHEPKSLEWIDYVPQETMFWRKRAWDRVGGINPSFQFALDWDLLARFTQAEMKIVRLPYYLGCFRVHPTQKTSAAIHTTGAEEMARVRTSFHGAEKQANHEIINAWARRIRFRGGIDARLLQLGIRW